MDIEDEIKIAETKLRLVGAHLPHFIELQTGGSVYFAGGLFFDDNREGYLGACQSQLRWWLNRDKNGGDWYIVPATVGEKQAKYLIYWSGRRDSNPRPQPWQNWAL